MHWRQQVLNDSLDSFDTFLLRILQFERKLAEIHMQKDKQKNSSPA